MNKAFTRDNDTDDEDDPVSLPAIPAGSRNYMTPVGYRRLKDEYLHLLDVERPALVQTVAWAASNGDRSENGDYIYGKKRLREIDRRLRFLAKRMENSEVIDPVQRAGCEQVFFGATVTVRSRRGGAKPSGAGRRRGFGKHASRRRSRLVMQDQPWGAKRGASHPVGAQLLLGDNCSGKTSSRSNSCAPTPDVSEVRHEEGSERTYSIVGIDEADAGRGLISWVSPLARVLLKAREDDTVKLPLPDGAEELVVVRVEYCEIDFG